MTTSPDLMHAILSMDAYNRGYGAGIQTLSESGALGNATIREFEEDEQDGWESEGFYSIAYRWNGQTIISYRGTNFDPGESISDFLSSPLIDDAINGWGTGAGIVGSQAGLAIRFYREVIGDSANPFTANVTLTGHSLGGGLAGFVGSLYGRQGYLYCSPSAPMAQI